MVTEEHRRLRCELKSRQSLQLITAYDLEEEESLVAEVDSPEDAIRVFTLYFDEDPEWKKELDWKPVPKEED